MRTGLKAAIAPVFGQQLNKDFRIGPVHIGAARKGLVKVRTDLAAVLQLMDLANIYNRWIDHPTWEAIRNAMAERDDEPLSKEVVRRFLSLMSQPGRLADLLRRLHQLRALEKIIPAMKHARCLVQFTDYHKYTVDEHSIRTVECTRSFLTTRDRLAMHTAVCVTNGYYTSLC